MNYIKKNMFRNLYKKLSKNMTFWIAIGLLVIILIIILYHIFIKSRVLEGLSNDKMTVVPIQMNSENPIQKIIIQKNGINANNDEWLNFSELAFYKLDGVRLKYGTNYNINSTGVGWDNNVYGVQKLSDGDYGTIFHSDNTNCTLTVTFTPATTEIYHIVIRNRLDCPVCYGRIANYSMSMFDPYNKKLCNDIQLSNPALYNNQTNICAWQDSNCNQKVIPKYQYDNVITYELVQVPVGPTGPRGFSGPIGPAGPQGYAAYGPKGDDGIMGKTGPIGEEGKKGLKGIDGVTGPIGSRGKKGEKGVLGPTGYIGNVGPLQSIINSRL